MVGLLDGSIDAAEAMTYNEYAQVLEAVNPDTGELYTPDDLSVISYEEVGVGMLQDAIWADESRLAEEPEYVDIATRFVAASIEGWAFCRDNPEECRDIVVAAGSQLGEQPPAVADERDEQADLAVARRASASSTRTRGTARSTSPSTRPNLEGATVLTAEPSEGAYTNDIVTAAHALLPDDLDITGESFEPIPQEEVLPEEGGA